MKAPITKYARLPLLIAGVAAILLSTAAATSTPLLEWLHHHPPAGAGTGAQASDSPFPNTIEPRAATRCTECGVVESTRSVAQGGNLPALHEITVRLRDGSIRVSSQLNPAQWRVGERIILIDGTGRRGA